MAEAAPESKDEVLRELRVLSARQRIAVDLQIVQVVVLVLIALMLAWLLDGLGLHP